MSEGWLTQESVVGYFQCDASSGVSASICSLSVLQNSYEHLKRWEAIWTISPPETISLFWLRGSMVWCNSTAKNLKNG